MQVAGWGEVWGTFKTFDRGFEAITITPVRGDRCPGEAGSIETPGRN
jgi:hypothetical protein